MVATTECSEKSKFTSGNKVSKPLMEKKRRARINHSLDQLKSLLENYYSSSIRKRKLEKADILELTVKHIRNLQKIQRCTTAASEFPEYQTGFRTCLANINQYLVMTDKLKGRDRWMLTQLSDRLSGSGREVDTPSTMDSGLEHTEAPAAGRTEAVKLNSANTSKDARMSSQDVISSLQNINEKSHKKCDSVSHRNEAGNAQQIMWRPW